MNNDGSTERNEASEPILRALEQPVELIERLMLRLDRINEIARQANRSIRQGRYADLDQLMADARKSAQ